MSDIPYNQWYDHSFNKNDAESKIVMDSECFPVGGETEPYLWKASEIYQQRHSNQHSRHLLYIYIVQETPSETRNLYRPKNFYRPRNRICKS